MPFILISAALILIPTLIALSVPLSLVMRYRTGTARRPARVWIAATNFFFMGVSAAVFLVTAAVSNHWVPGALRYSLLGFVGGLALGIVGLFFSRWETTAQTLHYTPNRWLVLSITLLVTARICFGLWRAWHAWHFTPADQSWLAASGLDGSLAVGAVVLGYYLAYWGGVWTRVKKHTKQRPAW